MKKKKKKKKANAYHTSAQPFQNQETKHKEDDNAGPEDPSVLSGPSLHHPDRVSADAERVCNPVQPPLRPLEHLPLVAEIAEHGAAALDVLVELGVRGRGEGLFAHGVSFARHVCG